LCDFGTTFALLKNSSLSSAFDLLFENLDEVTFVNELTLILSFGMGEWDRLELFEDLRTFLELESSLAERFERFFSFISPSFSWRTTENDFKWYFSWVFGETSSVGNGGATGISGVRSTIGESSGNGIRWAAFNSSDCESY